MTTRPPTAADSEENSWRRYEERINRLEMRVRALEKAAPESRTVILRTIPEDEARHEIAALFEEGKELFYSDVAERLGLDLALVVRLCEQLAAEGRITPSE
jgi:hypothetical protein